MEELFEAVLRGEHGEDLSPAEAEAFAAWLEGERGRELLEEAERELDPLADAFDPTDPGDAAWSQVQAGISAGLSAPSEDSGVIVRPPELAPEHNWGLTALLAAGLLFAAAIGLIAMSPRDETGKDHGGTAHISTGLPTPFVYASVVTAPEEPLPELDAARRAAKVDSLEAGAGYEAASAVVREALLVITLKRDER